MGVNVYTVTLPASVIVLEVTSETISMLEGGSVLNTQSVLFDCDAVKLFPQKWHVFSIGCFFVITPRKSVD